MKKIISLLALAALCLPALNAETISKTTIVDGGTGPGKARVFTLDLDGNEAPLTDADDNVTYNADGGIQGISGTKHATVKVFLPEEELNSGAAVIICSGGALMFHSWGNDVESMASWLNKRGVAVIGLKYRLNTAPRQMPAAAPQGGANPFAMALNLPDITGFDQLEKANANPNKSAESDAAADKAADDAIAALRLVRSHAAEWGIDPAKVGFLGYSAGGGVAIAAVVKASDEDQPAFLATCYGPSLVDVTVPRNAPKLFVATRAEHLNVAAGLLALYLEWKKAGANAEMYIYDDGKMGFGPEDTGSTSGTWRDSFFRWMTSNGWAAGQNNPMAE